MQMANEMMADGCGMLARQVQPMKNGIGFAVFDPADRPQAVTFDQHGNSIQQDLSIGAQGFKESSFVERKGLLARYTVISAFNVTMDFNVLSFDLCRIITGFVIAPLLFFSHYTSPFLLEM
jgi:hypothetical protein